MKCSRKNIAYLRKIYAVQPIFYESAAKIFLDAKFPV